MAVTKDKPATIALGCTAAGGRPLTYWTTQALRGKVSEPNAAGQVIYTPPAGGLGADSFVITADDGAAGAAPVTISLAIKSPPPPSPPPPPPPPPPAPPGPTPAQLLAGVRSNLAASVAKLKKKTAASVRKAGGATLMFKFLKAGTVAVGWTAKGKPVARGTASRGTAATATVRVKLTSAGKKLLKRKPTTKLTAKLTFIDTATLRKSSATKTFKLRLR